MASNHISFLVCLVFISTVFPYSLADNGTGLLLPKNNFLLPKAGNFHHLRGKHVIVAAETWQPWLDITINKENGTEYRDAIHQFVRIILNSDS
jgi:hypothetical protein